MPADRGGDALVIAGSESAIFRVGDEADLREGRSDHLLGAIGGRVIHEYYLNGGDVRTGFLPAQRLQTAPEEIRHVPANDNYGEIQRQMASLYEGRRSRPSRASLQ